MTNSIPCYGTCPVDNDMCQMELIRSIAVDKYPPYFERAKRCTPYHTCCCLECNGEVAVNSKQEICTGTFCRIFAPTHQMYEIGLQDATAFSNHMNVASVKARGIKKEFKFANPK